MRLVGCALLCLVACSGPSVTPGDAHVGDAGGDAGADPNDGARSGTRLKLTWFDFTDATRQWDGFYDAQRKEHCYIYPPFTNGKTYCVPDSTGSVVYADAACTTRMLQDYNDPNCVQPPPSYALEYAASGCVSQVAHLYPRGSKLAATSYYTKDSSGACSGPFNTGTTYTYYGVGAEVMPAELVEVTLGAPEGSGRLAPRFYTSADGMRFPWILHDSTTGTDCYGSYYADSSPTATCEPANAAYAGYNHDAACSMPEAEVNKSCAAPPYVVYYPAAACPMDAPKYYTTGAQLASTPLYYQSGNSCISTTPSTSYNYYAAGQAIDLPTMMRTPATVPSHRIQLIHYTTSDGLSFRDYALYDSQEGADCYPTKLPDGSMRCIVYGGYVSTYFKDAACTQTIDLVEVSTGPATCGAPTVPKFARKYITPAPGSCSYGTEVHAITSAYAGTVYHNVGTCQAYTPVRAQLYSIGPAVSVNEFIAATSSIDP